MKPTSTFFSYDQEKVTEAILYIIERVQEPASPLRISKFLYFADKTHLEKYARPITGDDYVASSTGVRTFRSYETMKASELSANNPTFHRLGHAMIADRKSDFNEMSESDIEVLQQTINIYDIFPTWHINKLSQDSIWYKTRPWPPPTAHATYDVDFLDVIESVDEEGELLAYLMRDADEPVPDLNSDNDIY